MAWFSVAASDSRRMEQRLQSGAAGNFCELMEYLEAAFVGEADVFVCALRCAGKAKDGVAAGDEAIGDGVEDFVVDGVAWMFGAGFAEQGKGEPFADERDVAGAVEREGHGLKVAQVLGHFFGIVAGAGAIGSGDEDHHWICGHGESFRGEFDLLENARTCTQLLVFRLYRAYSCNVK